MSISSNIRKIIFISVWCLAGAGLVLLLLAANKMRNERTCKGYLININGDKPGQWFVDSSDIIRVLTENHSINLKNKSIKSFDLRKIESRLRNEVWVQDAELFFNSNGKLLVNVQERSPIARIFSSTGNSFYIDSTLHRLPLSDKMSVKLPVFTNFPSDAKKWKTPADRNLVKQIQGLSMYISSHPFWMAQVAQIDITTARNFEMVATIGNHIVELGDGSDCESKFNRLMIFYKQVLTKTGMDKYERIKVQYDKEVIGVKKQNNN
jgi:cell division protein FtsQ